MKRVFEIEFPDECGEMWMNQDNLMLCINAYCDNKDGRIRAKDVTEQTKPQGANLARVRTNHSRRMLTCGQC